MQVRYPYLMLPICNRIYVTNLLDPKNGLKRIFFEQEEAEKPTREGTAPEVEDSLAREDRDSKLSQTITSNIFSHNEAPESKKYQFQMSQEN